MHDDSADKVSSIVPNFSNNEELMLENNFFNKEKLPFVDFDYQKDDMKIWQ